MDLAEAKREMTGPDGISEDEKAQLAPGIRVARSANPAPSPSRPPGHAPHAGVSLMDHQRGLGTPVPPAHHGHRLDPSACRDLMTLPSQPSALGSARARAQQVLSSWGFGPQLSADVVLCLSELATNALQASAVLRPVATPVHVALAHQRRWLLLAVADASPRSPLRLSADGDAVGGRGLAIVEALSIRWGWHPVSRPGLVKVVWAEWDKD